MSKVTPNRATLGQVLSARQMKLIEQVIVRHGEIPFEVLEDFARVMTCRVDPTLIGNVMPEYFDSENTILEDYFTDKILMVFKSAIEKYADWSHTKNYVVKLLCFEINDAEHAAFFKGIKKESEKKIEKVEE